MNPIFPTQNMPRRNALGYPVDAFPVAGLLPPPPPTSYRRAALLVMALAGMFSAGISSAQNDPSPSASPSSLYLLLAG
jgi:hypothetical protein